MWINDYCDVHQLYFIMKKKKRVNCVLSRKKKGVNRINQLHPTLHLSTSRRLCSHKEAALQHDLHNKSAPILCGKQPLLSPHMTHPKKTRFKSLYLSSHHHWCEIIFTKLFTFSQSSPQAPLIRKTKTVINPESENNIPRDLHTKAEAKNRSPTKTPLTFTYTLCCSKCKYVYFVLFWATWERIITIVLFLDIGLCGPHRNALQNNRNRHAHRT